METDKYSLERLSIQAKIEIGEANADLEKEGENVKIFLRENHNGIELPRNFDHFYLKCLRARKFNVERAAKIVVNYFRLLYEISYIHKYMLPSANKELFEGLGFTVLKQRDALGRAVVFTRQEYIPGDKFHFDQIICATMLLVDQVTKISEDTQRLGFVLIADLAGYGLAHLKTMRPHRVRSLVKFFQNAFPARVKGFHFVRNPVIFSYFYSVAKPFLSEKLKSRIHFHSYNFPSLHQHFSLDMLPEYLRGSLSNDDYVDRGFTSGILEDEQYYKELLECAQKLS